jgi:hypothetical protein
LLFLLFIAAGNASAAAVCLFKVRRHDESLLLLLLLLQQIGCHAPRAAVVVVRSGVLSYAVKPPTRLPPGWVYSDPNLALAPLPFVQRVQTL